MKKKKILFVFGTRPEAIKMCPLIKELKKNNKFQICVCLTGQHKEMLEQVMSVFDVIPDYNLNIMRKNQTLFDITEKVLRNIKDVILTEKPDLVLVHGDTTTTFASALAAYYLKVPIGHVEAGLRTYDVYSPFPEEFNRQSVSIISQYNFAPTELSKDNLIREGKDPTKIFVTGNTVIDALKDTVRDDYNHPELEWVDNSRLILVTIHRRENQGKALENIFNAILRVVDSTPDVKIIYPIHLNPILRETAVKILGNHPRIHLIEPLNVIDCHNIMAKSFFILTDSGGIQEEAPSLGKPVLVARNVTERPEGVKAGTLRIVGTDEDSIYDNCKILLDNKDEYQRMSATKNPYGDGFASKRIIKILEEQLK